MLIHQGLFLAQQIDLNHQHGHYELQFLDEGDNAKQKDALVGFVVISFWYSQPLSVVIDQWDL